MNENANTNNAEKKILYFEGAGMATPETVACGVGYCRIRTAFHTTDGKRVYLEMGGYKNTRKEFGPVGTVFGHIDYAHYITDGGDDCNNSRIKKASEKERFEYTPDAILGIVSNLGGDFDAIKVVDPLMSGYYVFNGNYAEGPNSYNYGDEFAYDDAATLKRRDIKDEVYRLEYVARKRDKATGGKLFGDQNTGIWPNFSLWAVDGDPCNMKWLVHFSGRNCEKTININAGSVTECIKAAAGWADENYGDFSTLR